MATELSPIELVGLAARLREQRDYLLVVLETVRTHGDTPEALARYVGDAVQKARDIGRASKGAADPADSGEACRAATSSPVPQ